MELVGKNKNGFDQYSISVDECKKMQQLASEALKYTYPTSGIGFATTVLTKNGKMITGASYTTDVHNQTMHGEAVALASAAQVGETEIVAIIGPNCHNCKQLIWESSIRSKIDTMMIVEEDGVFKQIPISELMQYPWPDHLGNK
jgi:cytidine deaminase